MYIYMAKKYNREIVADSRERFLAISLEGW